MSATVEIAVRAVDDARDYQKNRDCKPNLDDRFQRSGYQPSQIGRAKEDQIRERDDEIALEELLSRSGVAEMLSWNSKFCQTYLRLSVFAQAR